VLGYFGHHVQLGLLIRKGQSFHFSRFYRGELFVASLASHEHYLAAQIFLCPGMRILDVEIPRLPSLLILRS